MVDHIKSMVRQNIAQGLSQGTSSGPRKVADVAAPSRMEPSTEASLSSKATISDLAQTPPIDLEAVGRIKEAIAKGEYPINLDRIADKLMESYLEMKG